MKKYKLEDGSIIDVTDYSQELIDFLLKEHPGAELLEETEEVEGVQADFQNDSAAGVDVLSKETPTPMGTVLDLEDTSSESQDFDPKNFTKRDSLVFSIQETEKQINNYIAKGGEVNASDAAALQGYKDELAALDEQSFFDDIFSDEPVYDKTKSFRNKRNKINQMAKDRAELERKATVYSYNNMSGLESVAYVEKQLKEFDKTAAKELDILNYDPEFKLRNDAIEQLSKDTGNKQATGDGLEDTLSEFNILNVFRGKSYFKDIEANEIIDLNAEVEDAVVSKLNKKQLQKLSKGFYTLQEKENLLNEVKIPIVQKKIKEIETENEFQLTKSEDEITGYKKTQESIADSLRAIKNKPDLTQQDVDEYNLLVNDYKQIDKQIEKTIENFESYKSKSSSKIDSLQGDFGIDLATGVISNNFKLTDKVEKFREKYSGDGWWNGTADILGGELLQGAYQLLKKRYIGAPTWLLTSFGDAFQDQENYSDFDAFSDVVNNWSNKTLLPKSEDERFKITKKEGGFKEFDARNYAKLGVSMIPFTAQLIAEVKKGKFTGLRSAIGKNYLKLGDKSKILKDASQQLKNNIIMADAAFRATVMDNQKEGEALGLNGIQASTFAAVKSATEASVQLIMPDTQFLKGVTGKAIKDAFVGNLKKVANIEGAKSAVKEFSTNILKEYGEEQVNAAMNLVTDASYGLALPEASEFLNSQIELAAGTFMLSGGMGTVGSSKTFSNQKKLIYNQIHDNIASLDLGLKTMQEASKNPENIAEIAKTRQFAKDIFKAVESSPENVTADQIDLLLEKQKLIKKKETTDSAFHSAIDKKIKEVDAKIEDSSVKRDIAQQFDKDVSNVSKSLNSIGQKVDETLVLEDNEESSASDQMREILIKKGESKEYAEANKDSYGAFITIDGKEVLVINKTSSLSDSVVTTGQHEFLHKLLRASLSSNPEMITKAGQMLLKEIGQTVSADSEIMSRITDYSSDTEITSEKFFEEILPLFSEALTKKDVKLNESSISKIGDFFRRVFQNAGWKKINFGTAKGVVNFIKDYNKAYSKGDFKGSLKELSGESGVVSGVSFSKKIVELKEELDALDEFDFEDEFAFDAAKSNLENKIKTAERNAAKAKTESAKKPTVKKETSDKESKPKKVYNNEKLVETIKSEDTSSREKTAAEADLVDSFDTMALNAIKYDTRKGDYDRTEVRDYLRGFFPTILESYNPDESKFSTWVYNNIAPKAQQTYEKFKKIAEKSLDAEAGTAGSVREAAADAPSSREVITDKVSRKIKPIELVRDPELKDKYKKAVKNIVESGKVSIDESTFGNLKDLAAEVTAEIFDIPILKVTDPADNLTYKDVIVEDSNINKIKKYYPDAKVGMVIKSESSKIQDVVKSMGTDLFKLLPPENVSPELATVDAQAYKRVKGTGLKIPSSLMKVFYEATGKRSKGVTSQTAIKRLKPGLTYEQFLKDLGIVKGQPNTYDRAIGQRLKAITTLFGKLATNAEVRQLEGVTDIQKQNIEAGKSDIMFSKKSKDLLNKFGLNYTEIRSKNDVDIYIEKMVKPLINVFNSEDYKLLNRTVLQFRSKAIGGDKNIADYLRSELKKLNLPKRVSVGRTKPSAAIGNTIEKFEKSRKSGKIDKYNKRNSEVFDKMWNDINDIVSKDPNMAVPIMYFLENSINEATNPHRMGAPIIGYEINAGKLYYEHAVQSQLSYLNLMESILDPNKDFSSEFIKIKENYKVIAISKTSNNKLNQAGYALTMPKNWKNWYDRYFNKKVAAIEGGIDPSKLINLNGITFSNEFNIDNKGSKEDGTRLSKVIKEQEIKNNLGLQPGSNHDLLLEVGFSKKKRAEYENVLKKNRPDIKDVPKQVENLFEWADNLNVPENKKPKYKKLALYYTSNGYTIFPEDGYKIEEVIRLSDKNKIDPYAYKNPDELINKFTEEVKTKKINPDNVKQFSNKQEFENGVVVYDVQDSRRGQRAVRDVVDSYWGKDSNPWCLIARKDKRQRVIEDFNQFNTEEEAFKYGDKIKSNGLQVEYELLPDGEGVGVYTFKEAIDEKADLDEAWKMWKEYNQDGLGEGYKIAFQNGKLVSFRDGGSQQNFDTLGYSEVEWWDRFDKPTENLAVSLGVDKATGYKIIGSMDAEGDFDIDGYGEGDFMSQKNNYTLYDADKNLTRKEVYKDGKISLTVENERSRMKDGGQAIARIDTKYIDGVFKSSRYVLEDLNTGDIVNEITRKQTTLDIDSYIQEEVITRKNGKSPKVSKVTFKTTKLIDSSVKDSMNIVTYYDETITDGVSVISTDRMAELEEIKKSYVSFSKSVNQAAKANNNMLPESQRIKGSFTNQDVLNKMIDLDEKQREAQISFSKKFNLDKDFNDIIENKTGIAAEKTYGKVKAEVVGASKGKFDFFIAPSAEDFVGLLYKTLGKGSKGDAQMAWYKKHLLDPFAKAMNNVSRDRATMGRDFKALKKDLKIVPKNLKKRLPGEYFTREQAVRVYIWEQIGADVPGLSEADKKTLVDIVKDDSNLQLFANEVMKINKGIAYAKPSENWVSGTITTDLTEGLNSVKRKQYLELWQQNVDEIFSEKNLNKLEAAYGKSYRYALEGTLKRMKTGRNRTFGTDSLTGRFLDWINGTTGAIMFFNSRSAVLQTISMANFINFEDNNVFAAAKAFANQKQYWSDFKMLFNSDFLVERRDGLKLNVQESDIADIAKERGVRGVVNRILKLGFTPTQLADSFAIASGGSTFYRNRLNKLIKEGMDPLAAKKQAMMDFRETAEESQQSSRPDKISQQQAGPLGRTVLAFANTPAQYARIMKKAALDIKNGRGDFKTNVSKIMYYGFLQNLIFNTLTNALFAIEFGEDEEEENKKYVSVANGMADSILRGIGVSGVIVSVLKNAALTFVREDKKKNPNYEKVVDDLLRISPPIASKASKIKSASRSYKWDKKEMGEKGFSLDNPAYLAGANVVSAATNLPLDRVIKKMDHIRAASNSELETYKRIFLLAGWSEWDLGIKKPKKSTKSGSKTKGFSSGSGFSSGVEF